MITISFTGHPKAQAIILDEVADGVSGVVECGICGGRLVLKSSEIEVMSDEVEKFIKEHDCEPLARESEVIDFAKKLKKSMPGCFVKVRKGRKVI